MFRTNAFFVEYGLGNRDSASELQFLAPFENLIDGESVPSLSRRAATRTRTVDQPPTARDRIANIR